MKAFVFVLVAVATEAAFKKYPTSFLEAAVEEVYTPNPEGYLEDYRDMIWVILANAYDNEDDRGYVSERMINCSSLSELQSYLDDYRQYCTNGLDEVDIYYEFIDNMDAYFGICITSNRNYYYSTFNSFYFYWRGLIQGGDLGMLKTETEEEEQGSAPLNEDDLSASSNTSAATSNDDDQIVIKIEIFASNEFDCEESLEDEIEEESQEEAEEEGNSIPTIYDVLEGLSSAIAIACS